MAAAQPRRLRNCVLQLRAGEGVLAGLCHLRCNSSGGVAGGLRWLGSSSAQQGPLRHPVPYCLLPLPPSLSQQDKLRPSPCDISPYTCPVTAACLCSGNGLLGLLLKRYTMCHLWMGVTNHLPQQHTYRDT